ncbi:MAG: hypothetical protein NZP74_12990 [Anaerolineales bacterium]|nr:hypothetical protein [Anaerolineales bacterium]MDW8276840.1 hypothetical protein [Anaerolineales bacterium]
MEYSFPRYLLAKQSVDDRALNKDVLAALRAEIAALQAAPAASQPFRVIEIGAGIGTMLARLLRWKVLPAETEYTLVDSLPENIAFARQWLPQWAQENGWSAETVSEEHIRFSACASVPSAWSVSIRLVQADVFDFIHSFGSLPGDLLIAHAFLDLLPLPESLPPLFSLVRKDGCAWFTINFDGVTTFEPSFSPAVDALIEKLYHETMDTRPGGGDSRTGRHLFGYLQQNGVEILAAGASDWVVHPVGSSYLADEAYFLHFILHFFETSLGHHPGLDSHLLAAWLQQRRAQIERAELVYIAHQMDFLIRC